MGGERDWICSADQSRQMAAALPRAHLKLFPDCAHSLAAESTEEFRAALRGFLTHFTPCSSPS